jgi:mannose-6-phosphate isomerase-like protein (cupin superfamily)
VSEGANLRAAELVLPCADIDAGLELLGRLGFRIESIRPADDPAEAVVSGHGMRIRLRRGQGDGESAGHLRLLCRDPAALGDLVAGLPIELARADEPLVMPPLAPSLCITRDADGWRQGRAGMLYRDLIPDRQGGRFIASHIRIPEGGPVPDYVHYHRIRVQMIYCRRGWVRVLYEDQGPPFVMRAGDCVLQPPLVRHRVLDCSPGLEVIELSSPAEHETFADHDLELPTATVHRDRDFGGQRFVHHQADRASWRPHRRAGFQGRDLGIAAATAGAACAHVLRPLGAASGASPAREHHAGELLFLFVLAGAITVDCDGREERLSENDAAAIPPALDHALLTPSADLELLEIAVPA